MVVIALSYRPRIKVQTASFAESDPTAPLSSRTILLCSAIAKMTASIATYPHEVVRTRLQTQRRPLVADASSDGMIKNNAKGGIIYTTKKLIRKEGWRALYKGLSINLIRTVPNSAVTMLTYVSASYSPTTRRLTLFRRSYELLMRYLSERTPS